MPLEEVGTFILPFGLPEEIAGFGLDWGGSLMKFACVSQNDGKQTHLKLCLIANEESEEGLKSISQIWKRPKHFGSENAKICVTGAGSNTSAKLIEAALRVKLVPLSEFTVVISTLRFLLKNIPLKDIVHPHDLDAVKEGELQGDIQHGILKSVKAADIADGKLGLDMIDDSGSVGSLCDTDVTEHKYPFLMFWTNSAQSDVLVQENGQYQFLDCNWLGLSNKSSLAIALALTGAKSFAEFIELAEKGKSKNVDQYLMDVLTGEEDGSESGDIYKENSGVDFGLYSFGKMIRKDIGSFAKEDIARSWLTMQITSYAQNVVKDAQIAGVQDIVCVGSIFNVPLIRSLFVTKFAYNIRIRGYTLKKDFSNLRLHIIKYGSHVGAIGALLQDAKMLQDPWI